MSSKRYTKDFKEEAVSQVIERGYSIKEVSERLGVSLRSMYMWVSKVQGNEAKVKADDTQREIARLKSELRRVEEERDILKKAAAYFAKASE
jgi:transposase